MQKALRLFLILACCAAAAEDGARLSDAEIRAVLENATAVYRDGARQFFAAGGRTEYLTAKGLPSAGQWSVRGGKYCSVWGAGAPSCYIVTRHGEDNTGGKNAPVLRWDGEYEAAVYPGNILRQSEK